MKLNGPLRNLKFKFSIPAMFDEYICLPSNNIKELSINKIYHVDYQYILSKITDFVLFNLDDTLNKNDIFYSRPLNIEQLVDDIWEIMPNRSINIFIIALIYYKRFYSNTILTDYKINKFNAPTILFICFYTAHINYDDGVYILNDFRQSIKSFNISHLRYHRVSAAIYQKKLVEFYKRCDWKFYISNTTFINEANQLNKRYTQTASY